MLFLGDKYLPQELIPDPIHTYTVRHRGHVVYEDEIYEYNTSPDVIPKYRYPQDTHRYPGDTQRYPNSGEQWSQWDRVNYVNDPVLQDDNVAMILFDTLFNDSVSLSCDNSLLLLTFPAVFVTYLRS